jgi:hypothetical protein
LNYDATHKRINFTRGATVQIFENSPTILYIMHAVVPCTYERRSRGELEKTGEKQRRIRNRGKEGRSRGKNLCFFVL